jgi:methyltransferase-like protein/2-polyprenyl-3-methyl-5-hydroxy-6-metoxy-1,4-benzoquinol methylase
MNTEATSSYDQVPYESFPFPQTHPDRLATIGRLFGLAPPELARCRVLELGCAAGGNLIPLAVALPGAEFVGVDLSAVQVAQGQAVIAALGLDNVRLQAMSITDVDETFGAFDYILCHGVYSWVPDLVQDKILALCARQLTDQGIAYLSYNTLPGWRMRGMIRDLMRYHAMQFAEPGARVTQGRAILDFLAKSVPAPNDAYGMLLQSELKALRHAPDYYILHEHLEDINEPLYFHEFMARARGHGLQYLAEAEFSTMLLSNFPAEAAETLWRIAPDVIRQEQFMDFLRNRSFRQTLLVRDGLVVNRSVPADRVTSLWIGSRLRPLSARLELRSGALEEFRSPDGGSLRTPNPITKAAMMVLAGVWPGSIPFPDLLAGAQDELDRRDPGDEAMLASDLLQCHGSGLVEFHAAPDAFVTRPGARPVASSLARLQAARGGRQLTNLRHEMVSIDENLGRVLMLLDGSRGRKDIHAAVTDWVLKSPAGRGRTRKELAGTIAEPLDQALAQLAGAALLLG